MKSISVSFCLAVALITSISSIRADALFNPTPTTIESPHDDADAVTKRLTTNSDGKTPVVKNLDPTWIKTLADRGEPTTYTKENSHNFDYLGMPVGGIGSGEIYLSGDGRLWEWDIFGTRCQIGFPVEQGLAYKTPHIVGAAHDSFQEALEQGFVVRTVQGGQKDTRRLDKSGFANISFSGQYPIGSVDYSDPASPVHVHLEAFSPFIPGNVDDSSYPATILNYTVENTSKDLVECTLGGWMENPVGISLRNQTPVLVQNTVAAATGYTALNFSMKEMPAEGEPPTIFDDFESGKYDHWKVEGDAFGTQPSKIGGIRHNYPVQGPQGSYFVDSFLNRNDTAKGKLTSETFVISRPYITFLIGGGKDATNECVNLVIDDKVVQTATGQSDEMLRQVFWDVKDLKGKTAHLEILDQKSEGWGHIMVDNIAFADSPASVIPVKEQPDVGNMTLALLGDGVTGSAQLANAGTNDSYLDSPAAASAEQKVFGDQEKLIGSLHRTVSLKPGEKMTVSFIVSWYFPNKIALGLQTSNQRQYGVRFKSSQDVVDHVLGDLDRLTSATRQWRDNWYDSTLPYYFLDRTFLNVSTLASSTSYLLSDGRFYGYEGRYSCPGTCTHVWGYQQAIADLFPDLEKSLMEKVEFVPGLGMNDKGGVAMRGEYDHKPPVDGQAGIILRAYLTHRMSADNSFLQRNYASIKKATDFLINTFDQDKDGIMEGPQANTMDAAWYGKNTWMSLHYQAALRATAEMADLNNDAAYGASLRAIADKGRAYIETKLFNGEYFIHEADPAHPTSPGTYNGCPIEQLMGQNWAYQVGLGDIVDHTKAVTALNSIWKYDYTTDVGVYRKAFPKGRWYAVDGEGALIMCSFPQGDTDSLTKGDPNASAYDNESWTGSEHEATALMMWDGLVDKALAEEKTIQDRYDGAKRNPWDECECGSHYSRGMASYGVFIAACGFEYNGPAGTMAFAPRVGPENFKAAFTSAEGWGSFSQQYQGKGLKAALTLKHGKLRLKTLSLILPPGSEAQSAKALIDGKDQPVSVNRNGNRIALTFSSDVEINTGQSLGVTITP